MTDDFNSELEDDDVNEEELLEEEEEISVTEVDLVLGKLEQLIETVQSETIQAYLEEAYDYIFHLVYEEDSDDSDELSEGHAEAA